MDKLLLEIPGGSDEEKALWKNLSNHMMLMATAPLKYRDDGG